MDRRVEAALTRLAGDSEAAISPEKLAALLSLSPSRLRYLFKKDVGTPLGAFARTARMEHAKKLLETSFFSVKQIAYELGLSDETHFIREFKKACGVTPQVYRERITSDRGGGGQSKKPINSQKSRCFFLACVPLPA